MRGVFNAVLFVVLTLTASSQTIVVNQQSYNNPKRTFSDYMLSAYANADGCRQAIIDRFGQADKPGTGVSTYK